MRAMSIERHREIVGSVLAGDKAAFGAPIERHRAHALTFARRILDTNEAPRMPSRSTGVSSG